MLCNKCLEFQNVDDFFFLNLKVHFCLLLFKFYLNLLNFITHCEVLTDRYLKIKNYVKLNRVVKMTH